MIISTEGAKAGLSWAEALRAFLRPQVIAMLFLGFSAGLPILLIFSTLSLWLREAEVSRATVTMFSWAALGYSFKFVWAPLVDRLPLPLLTRRLGRRRGWLLLAQLAIIGAIAMMAAADPASGLLTMALAAVLLGFSSATQDIVIDAYRIESADDELQALLASTYIAGYRIGMLVAGAGALYLAEYLGTSAEAYSYPAWRNTYFCMALVMLIGVATTLIIREPQPRAATAADAFRSTTDYGRFLALFALAVLALIGAYLASSGVAARLKDVLATAGGNAELAGFVVETLRLAVAVAAAAVTARLAIGVGLVSQAMVQQTYLDPVADFFHRYGRTALLILALIGCYRIADIVMGVIANVFYLDLGFSKSQIASVTKVFGLLMTLVGGFLGGLLALRFGVLKILWLGALLAAASNLLFALLAQAGANENLLIVAVAGDNLSAGVASAAFVAYLSSLTSVSFTAMQYAIFSSLMTLLPKVLGGYSGSIVDAIGYPQFFVFSALLGVPVLLLIWLVARSERLRPQPAKS